MRTGNFTIFFVLVFSGIFLFGCRASQQRPAAAASVAPSAAPAAPANAVESAVELSNKYAALSQESSLMKEELSSLKSENEKLKIELAGCMEKLSGAEKELNEANALLVDMRVELNNWKSNILGFRNEMRAAGTAQMEALAKILTILGAQSVDANDEPKQ